MSKSKIEWTEATWNPITGCGSEIISPGCQNCYARRMSKRLAENPKLKLRARFRYLNFNISFWPERLDEPLKRKKSTLYFVCSMGDMFHKDVRREWINQVVTIIRAKSFHWFNILTKRPERMAEYFQDYNEIIPNLGLGVTVCNQAEADEKIPILLSIPAAMRFVSIEPMLGPVDIENCLPNMVASAARSEICGGVRGVDWVICGGETGPGARSLKYGWVVNLVNQCTEAKVPFFFKKWGIAGNDFAAVDGWVGGLEWRQVPEQLKKFFGGSHV